MEPGRVTECLSVVPSVGSQELSGAESFPEPLQGSGSQENVPSSLELAPGT